MFAKLSPRRLELMDWPKEYMQWFVIVKLWFNLPPNLYAAFYELAIKTDQAPI